MFLQKALRLSCLLSLFFFAYSFILFIRFTRGLSDLRVAALVVFVLVASALLVAQFCLLRFQTSLFLFLTSIELSLETI